MNPNAPWEAERAISDDLVRALLARALPDAREPHLELMGCGWDNAAYLVDGEWVFRFPRRAIADGLLEIEARVLPAIAPLLPLSVPVPTIVVRGDERFPWPFAGYRRITGATACRAALDRAQRIAMAPPLGAFFAALHDVPRNVIDPLDVPGDTIGRLDVAARVSRLRDRLAKVVAAGVIEDGRAVERLLDEAPLDAEAAATNLVHGDMYARHLLVDAHGAACGVIDWGDVHLGDPAIDLSISYGFLPPEARDGFMKAYGRNVSAATERLARFRAAESGLVIAWYGNETGDADLVREGLTALEHVRH